MKRRQTIPSDMQQNTPFYSNYLIQNTKGSNFIMKTMKKIFALALAMMMVFSLALTANAALTTTGTVKITNAAAGETYEFYRIYDLDSVGNGGIVYVTNTKWGKFGENDYVTITDKNEVIGLDAFTDATAQTFAQEAMDENKDFDMTTDSVASSGVLEISGLQYGYYVMKSNRTNENPKYTVFTLSSNTALEITEKNDSDLPKFDKSVHEDSAAEGAFGDSNTADVGEEITFKLTVTAAAGTDTYQIVDKLTNLAFIEITSATVTSGNNTTNLIVNDDYTVTTNTDGFTVTFTENFRKTLKDNDKIEITYTAKLTEAAITDGEGKNEATFTYGDNVEIEDKTETKTYKITVTKTDDKNLATPLEGATFVLKKGEKFYYYDETADVVRWVDSQDEATKVTSGAGGVLTFAGIDADNYTLVEIDAPDGYVLPTQGEDVIVNENKEVTITNTLGEKLPETGGMGTTLFYTLGGLMVAAAAVLLITKKRMSAM